MQGPRSRIFVFSGEGLGGLREQEGWGELVDWVISSAISFLSFDPHLWPPAVNSHHTCEPNRGATVPGRAPLPQTTDIRLLMGIQDFRRPLKGL